jgi:hypothetical protein
MPEEGTAGPKTFHPGLHVCPELSIPVQGHFCRCLHMYITKPACLSLTHSDTAFIAAMRCRPGLSRHAAPAAYEASQTCTESILCVLNTRVGVLDYQGSQQPSCYLATYAGPSRLACDPV